MKTEKEKTLMGQGNDVVLYKHCDAINLEVKVENETVWLTQAQLVDLYNSSKANISEHIKNIFADGELDEAGTVRNFRTVQIEGGRKVEREVVHYNLDMILSLGYRINSKVATKWRDKISPVGDRKVKGIFS